MSLILYISNQVTSVQYYEKPDFRIMFQRGTRYATLIPTPNVTQYVVAFKTFENVGCQKWTF